MRSNELMDSGVAWGRSQTLEMVAGFRGMVVGGSGGVGDSSRGWRAIEPSSYRVAVVRQGRVGRSRGWTKKQATAWEIRKMVAAAGERRLMPQIAWMVHRCTQLPEVQGRTPWQSNASTSSSHGRRISEPTIVAPRRGATAAATE